ncbi:benzoate 4-monooxygenase cytochrome P450, partial [Aureobasidium melanogenum]
MSSPIFFVDYGLVVWPVIIYSGYVISQVVYRAFVHPLSNYPGPFLYAVLYVPYYLDMWLGRMHTVAKDLHDTYGDVVRISPTQLSYNTAGAWKDIYGHRPGKVQLEKDPSFYFKQKEGPSIFISDDADHSRMRRLVSHAFSTQALLEQEPLIMKIEYHPWITNIFKAVQATQMIRLTNAFPIVKLALKFKAKKQQGSGDARAEHQEYSAELVARRMATETSRKDFMSYILRYNDDKGMSVAEINQTAKVLVLAGSETTATLLAGAIFHLLKNPLTLKKLVDEVRSSYESERHIDLVSSAKLHYLQAVLDEALRLYPPVPGTMPRRTGSENEFILGRHVPARTSVGVSQWAANRSASNFVDPDVFIPERWLGDIRYQNDQRATVQPFSVGPRNCLGKNLAYSEMRTIMSKLLWNFDLELCTESSSWMKQKVFFMWDKPKLMVKLKPRM